ncbi:sensor histidine kinase [Parasphingorhabdus sp.]|uniref:sensor histidine kinase n=1 Tax=Parasphingorhabdus sp. TaxID=2709688 RepID=UPI003C7106F1
MVSTKAGNLQPDMIPSGSDPLEPERLATLHSYDIMDSEPEIVFDRLAHLAANIFKVPIASISLIDDERQWFKSVVGLNLKQTARKISFCRHIVDSREALIVKNAREDERFRNNPLVLEAPHLCFYAGAPLVAENGLVIGTLWIGDTRARSDFSPSDVEQLQTMADIVMSELELRREISARRQAQRQAAEDRANLELTLALSNTASFALNLVEGNLSWSGAYQEVWGEDAGEKLVSEQAAFERIHPEDRADVKKAMAAAGLPGKSYDATFRIVHPSGKIKWIHGYGDYIERNGTAYLTGLNVDISKSVIQQEQLKLHTRELHHRMRNLFATLQSIMSLTKKSATSIDDYIERIQGRLRALNRAQQILLDTNFVTGSLTALVQDLTLSYPRIYFAGPEITLPENAMVSMSLVLNELATNASKYGALAANKGKINVHWSKDVVDEEELIVLTWSENGSSKSIDAVPSSGFGSSLIDHSVNGNLQGEIEREWRSEGLKCTIRFPVPDLAD